MLSNTTNRFRRAGRLPVLVVACIPLLPIGSVQADDSQIEDAAEPEQSAATKQEASKGKILTLPIVITEPAIGEGLGAAIAYFHGGSDSSRPRVTNGRSLRDTSRRSTPPPTVTAVLGFYTNNDTRGYGIGHSRSLLDDKYRLVGILASTKVISNVYLLDVPFGFEVDGNVAAGGFRRRAGDSDVFLGMSLVAMDGDVRFRLDAGDDPPVELLDFSMTNVGVAGTLMLDKRDNTTMPNSGQLVDLSLWRYDDAIGSDFNYTALKLKLLSFHQLAEKFVLGLRFDGATEAGHAPFFAVPFVSLRGVPALRFQGKTAGALEIEGRYQFADRWAGVVFGGAGFTHNGDAALDSDEDITAYGAGFRYKAIEEKNVWLGIDVARGPEETAWYLQIGQGW